MLGVALVFSVLRWRHVLNWGNWTVAIVVLATVALVAWFCPGLFRSYYRFSTWAGFYSSQAVARVALAVIFAIVIVPAALTMRLLGKDPLRLRRSARATSYWTSAKPGSPLDRQF